MLQGAEIRDGDPKSDQGWKPPGASLRSGESATENTAKLSTGGWQREENNTCPSPHLLEQLDLES